MNYSPIRKNIAKLAVVGLLVFGGLSVSAVNFAEPFIKPLTTVAGTLFLATFESPQPLAQSPSITTEAAVFTDKADYAPGETVYITGYGFTPGESVRVQVVHVPDAARNGGQPIADHEGHDPWLVTANYAGRIETSWLVGEDSFGHTLLLTADGLSSSAHAQTTFTDSIPNDFKQCANNDNFEGATTLGKCHWIGSIVQGSNSVIFEGMSILQRAIFRDIPATGGNNHNLTFRHQSTKGGTHAYDMLTSWEQAIMVADDYGIPYTNLTAFTGQGDETGTQTFTTARACGEELEAPMVPICTAIRGGLNRFDVPVPNDPFISKDGSTQQRINAYETQYGNRYIRIYANAPIISASLVLIGHDPAPNGSDTGDSDVQYQLNWNSTATQVLIEFAGHLAITGTDGTGINWGPGLGSSQINGGPYHFNLDALDAVELGSQDNQVKGADIQIIPPDGAITITKDAIPDDAQDFLFTESTSPDVADFSLDDDGDPTLPNTRTFSGLATGTYTFTEGLVNGWDLTGLVCTALNPGATVAVNLATRTATVQILDATGAASCIYTNRKRGHIIVDKVTLPAGDPQSFNFDAGGGPGDPAYNDFSLTDAAAPNDQTLKAGTYSVSETVPAGWDLTSATCSDGSDPAAINLAEGETVTCTFTNTKRGRIIVDKVTLPAGDPQSFAFLTTGAGYVGFNVTDAAAPNSQEVVPGAYSVAETVPAGWDLTSSVCDQGETPASLDVGPGETVSCTFTNTKRGRIIVDKVTLPGGDPQSFAFLTTGAGYVGFNLTDAAPPNNQEVVPGAYSVAETVPTGWSLTSAVCDQGETPASLDVGPGETVSCTFTNSKPDAQIDVSPLIDTNPVNQAHTITATVQQDDQLPAGAPGDAVTGFGPAPDGTLVTFSLLNNTAGATFVGGVNTCNTAGGTGTCSVQINTSTAGGVDIHAATTFSVLGVSLTRATGTGGLNSADAHKTYVDAQIDVSPLVDTNPVNQAHTITATVQQDDGIPAGAPGDAVTGFGPAPDGTLVTFSLLNNTAGATFVGGVNTCNTTAGSCSVQINTSTAGAVDIRATTTFSVGGQSLTRTTGTGGLNSADAHKTYVDAQIDVTPLSDTNPVGQAHTITATVQQDDGIPAGAPGDAVTGFGPAPNGTTVNFSFVLNTAGATFVGGVNTCNTTAGSCSVSINSSSAGVVIVQATTTFSVGGQSLTRTTGTGGLNSPNAQKVYVDAQIDLSPLVDTNPVNEPHTITATVQQDDGLPAGAPGDAVTGFGPAPNGTLVTFSFVTNTAGAVFVGGINTCTTTGGTCSIQINASSPGLVVVHATTTFSVGGQSLTRATGTGGLNSPNAQKTYVSGVILVDKVTNPAADPQLFTFDPSWTADFQLADQTAPHNSGNLAPGIYSVAETVPAGWDLTSATCSDGSPVGAIDLAAGETVTCTFTNTKRSRIIVDKVTLPAGDPQSFAFLTTGAGYVGFSLTDAAAPNSQEVVPGAYSVAETVPAGWDLTSAVCDQGETPASLDVGPGETVTCTFTNTKRGRIIVDKVTLPAGDPQSFAFLTTGAGYVGFSLTDAAAPNSQEVVPGAYSVAETVPAGWDLTSAVCNLGETPASLDVGPGETVTCTFTNTKRGRVIVDKVTNPTGDPQSFDFTGSFGPFSLTDAAPPFDSGLIVPGAYNVAETVPAGWDLTSAVCDQGETPASLDVGPGETVTCTFTNTKRGRIQVNKTFQGGPIPADCGQGEPCHFDFQLRQGASTASNGTVLASVSIISTTPQPVQLNGLLQPGIYQVCEFILPGWDSDLRHEVGAFIPNSILPPDQVDNAYVCVNRTVGAGQTVTVTVDNDPPPGGMAKTIGFWKNWSSCTGGNQDPILDETLASFAINTPPVPTPIPNPLPTTHGFYVGDLYLDNCQNAVLLLGKMSIVSGKKLAKDPAFNTAAQYIAARLNFQAGAEQPACAVNAVAATQTILDNLNFNGATHSSISGTIRNQLNMLNEILDTYNNTSSCGP